MNVSVHPPHYVNLPFHSELEEPKKIGEFSVTRDREVVLDRSMARFVWPEFLQAKSVTIDLSEGFEDFENWPPGKQDRLDIISKWMMKSARPETDIKDEFQTDVITSRGVIKMIAGTPFKRTFPWTCVATKRKNIVYIYRKQSKHIADIENSRKFQLVGFQAHKFERCITVGAGQENPDPSPFVTVWEEFRVVVRTVLKRKEAWPIRILMTAEVDSIDIDDDLTEITTNAGPLNEHFWRWKSLNNWLQCKLGGVESVLVGIKDEDAVVRQIRRLTVDELEKGGRRFWSTNVCLDVMHSVLTCIRNGLKNNETCVVEYAAKMNAPITFRMVTSEEEPVLNQEFMDYFALG